MIWGKRNRDLPLCFPSVFECNGPLAQPAGDCCIDRVGAVNDGHERIWQNHFRSLKTYYRNAPVAVKIQKKHESLQEAADLLCRAGNKKRCSFLVLVRTSRSAGDQEAAVPANMIVMDSPELLLESGLSNQCSLYGVKSAQRL